MTISSLAMTAGAWVWEKYGGSVADKATGVAKAEWQRFKWKEAAEAYRAKTKKLYGTMQIMGMANPVSLDDIFTDAYMLDKPTAFSRFDIERLKQVSGDSHAAPDAKRINGLRLVVEKGNLFILGKPGAGKTTFLKYIALKAAEKIIDKIPIFISLKHWADSEKDLLPFIIERFDVCDFPAAEPFIEELLRSGTALVLFDGLDEVNQESGQRDKQTRAMRSFIEKYERTQCLITCRIAASDYSFKPFTYVEVADFTEKQIEIFVDSWFRDDSGEKDPETSQRFLREFAKADNKGLRDLARTPLLLTLLCLAFNETLTFPQRRVEIYGEALDALLKKWDASRRIKRDEVYRNLSLGHRENMLARIAAETFERNEYFIPQSRLERLITDYVRNVPPHATNEATDGEVILKAIEAQHGIFVERARCVYSFSHLTFQEFFTAKYIVANAADGTLNKLVRTHSADSRWREVFLLTTSLLSDATEFMKSFRRGIDELVNGDKKLISVLDWADKKASMLRGHPVVARPLYLSYVIPIPTPLELSTAFDRIDRYQGIALDRAFGQASARSPFFEKRVELTSEKVREISKGLRSAENLARKMRLSKLEIELRDLKVPRGNTFDPEWQEYQERLHRLMIEHRDLGHSWNLTSPQSRRLEYYIDACNLLYDCLPLAFMPFGEKEVIRNSLYLPLNSK